MGAGSLQVRSDHGGCAREAAVRALLHQEHVFGARSRHHVPYGEDDDLRRGTWPAGRVARPIGSGSVVMSENVILLEFNELSPTLMNRFINQGHLPNFKRFSEESAVYLTEAKERAPHLDPWIQWVTVHTGLNFDEHGLEQLNEGHTLQAKRIWDYVAERNGSSWICGSMNVGHRPGIRGAVMPDPWATYVKPAPDDLEPYFSFIQRNVLEYTNNRVPLTRADYVNFVKFMASHGLTLSTVLAIAKQLMKEVRGQDRWKRAVILDKLQFDVFRHFY